MQIAELMSQMGAGKALVTFIISMLPVVELRLAIPMGVSLGLSIWQAAVISVLGNILPVPFIIAFIRVVMDWLRTKSKTMQRFVQWLEAKGTGPKANRVRQFEFWGLLLFVAIPLPGTGAWTGALVAALLDVRMKRALPPIITGVVMAAVIVSLATAGVVTFLV
jgi:uncharacterized membrane protein